MAAESGSDNAEAKKPSFMSGLIGVVIVTLIAAGAGGGSAFYLVKQTKLAKPAEVAAPAKEAPGKEAPAKEAPAAATEELVTMALPVVLTNLADPPGIFVRLEAEIVLDAKSAKTSTALASEISGDYMAYLHTLSIANFEGASSFNQFKEDLTDRAQIRSKGLVREVVVKGLVVK